MSNIDANVAGLYKVYADIPEPVESYGMCIKKNCYGYGILGDGYCVRCWDKSCSNKHSKPKQS